MLVPAYLLIEQTARQWGYDPDRPPRLSKITETFWPWLFVVSRAELWFE
jgi:hypothetical protein